MVKKTLNLEENLEYINFESSLYLQFEEDIYLKNTYKQTEKEGDKYDLQWVNKNGNIGQTITSWELSKKNSQRTNNLITELKNHINKPQEEIQEFLEVRAIKIINDGVLDEYKNKLKNSNNYQLIELAKSPNNPINQMNVAKKLEKYYNIKKIIAGENSEYYYFNKKQDSYLKLNKHELGNLIKKDFKGINLPLRTIDGILSCIHRNDKINNHIWDFKNCLFSSESFETIKGNKKDNFVTKRIGFKHNGKFNKLNYYKNVKLINQEDKRTLIEKTLREILIPKNDQNNTDLYIDFLQRIGAILTGKNIYKSFVIYYNKLGDNGKSMLNKKMELLFNSSYKGIEISSLKDQFKEEVLNNANVIVFDELDENSFEGIIPTIKRFISPHTTTTSRKMFSTEQVTTKSHGIIFAFTNIIPKIPYKEINLFKKIDALELPNQFVIKEEFDETKNQYIIDNDIEEKIMTDEKGLSWLISAGIKAYKTMKENNETFKCKQTADKTLIIINKLNPLEIFLKNHLEIDKNGNISNETIVREFEKWCIDKKIDYNPKYKDLSLDVGYALKKHYKNRFKDQHDSNFSWKSNGRTYYRLNLLVNN